MNKILTIVTVVALASGCVRKETSHTFYLEPDGAVTWMVLEKDIRSDAGDLEKRNEEEGEFMDARRCGGHDVARALTELGAEWVETRVLREQRPYMVVTEARFDSIDRPLQSFFDRMEAPITAELLHEDERVRFVIACDLEAFDQAEQGEIDEEETEVFVALVGDAEDYRLVLTDGKFVEARGFEIVDEKTVAVLQEQTREEIEAIEEFDDRGRTVVYSLTWTTPSER